MTVNDPVALSPDTSVAVQVTVVIPSGNVLPEAWLQPTLWTLTLSVAVGGVNVTAWVTAPGAVPTVMLEGTPTKTGSSRSLTVTVKACEVDNPAVSVAVHVTVVTPRGNAVPDVGPHPTLWIPTLSVAVGANVTTRVVAPGAVPTLMLLGTTRAGTSLSAGRTVTVTVFVAVLVAASVAVHVTGVAPSWNRLPDNGSHTTVGTPMLSMAVGVKVTVCGVAARTVMSSCRITGGWKSSVSVNRRTRFCVVATMIVLVDVSFSLAVSTNPIGRVPSALFSALICPESPPTGPNVAAPSSRFPWPGPLSHWGLLTT